MAQQLSISVLRQVLLVPMQNGVIEETLAKQEWATRMGSMQSAMLQVGPGGVQRHQVQQQGTVTGGSWTQRGKRVYDCVNVQPPCFP